MFEIINETNEKVKEIELIQELLEKTVEKMKIEEAIFNVIIVDNAFIHKLNKEYRDIDRPTDVISFALEDDKTMNLEIRVLGDIYISLDKIYEQSKEYNHSFLREFAFLTIHGLLHLLGYDHMIEAEEKAMFSLQEEILNEAGITK